MAPGDRPSPDSLRARHGIPRPKMDPSSDYAGSFYSQSPASPPDGKTPYDPRGGGGWNSPSRRSMGSGAAEGTRSSEDRAGRRLEPRHGSSRERSAQRDPHNPRDRPVYQNRPNHRDRSRPNGQTHARSPGSSSRVCRKCGESLTGQFVRALGATFHLECFKCEVSSVYASSLICLPY